MKIKLNCIHADTCLPDYWRGHHLPHICVPVHSKMTIGELRNSLKNEIRQGAVAGSTEDVRLLSADFINSKEVERADALTRAVYAAINRDVKMHRRGARYPFKDIEDEENNDYSVYAYFVFTEDN